MPEKGRLQSHFETANKESQASKWDELWKSGEQDLWDRGHASPALDDYVKSDQCLIEAVGANGERRCALVPACGTGYDAVLLAQRGFEAYGLEVSSEAVEEAKKFARGQSMDAGKIDFVKGDFFKRDWLPTLQGQFDLVYDYTFLCALLPECRKDWSKRMSELVKPGMYLICLEFPLWKDLSAEGPPYGLKGVYWNLLAEGGDGMVAQHNEGNGAAGKGDFERMQYFRPPRTFKQGKESDMVSVWRRK